MTTIMRKEWLTTDMRKVLYVGPCNTPGGMAKVIQILSQNPPEGWQAEVLCRILLRISSKIECLAQSKKWIKKNYKIIRFMYTALHIFTSKKVELHDCHTNLVFQ